MRSRYAAYTLGEMDYIANTMKNPALAKFDHEVAKTWANKVEWIRLEVISSQMEGNKGFVEFLAYFYENSKRHAMHEYSEFQLIDGKWYYMDGYAPKDRPPFKESIRKRNDPCICGSGKKYKKCCGNST